MNSRIRFGSLAERLDLPAAFVFDLDEPLPAGFSLPDASQNESLAAERLPSGAARHFLLRRQIGRALVARCTGLDATAITISRDKNGAPKCLPESMGLHISFAYRQSFSAIALARQPIGVDLERSDAHVSIPWAVLHPREVMQLQAQPESRRSAAFLRLWTMKEACVKALGHGFRMAPDDFAIENFNLGHACSIGGGSDAGVHIESDFGNISKSLGLTIAAAIIGVEP